MRVFRIIHTEIDLENEKTVLKQFDIPGEQLHYFVQFGYMEAISRWRMHAVNGSMWFHPNREMIVICLEDTLEKYQFDV